MYYPPGIPLLIPGELICKDIIDFYKIVIKQKNVILGTKEINNTSYISVLKEDYNE
jgi:arginine decarboxylase